MSTSLARPLPPTSVLSTGILRRRCSEVWIEDSVDDGVEETVDVSQPADDDTDQEGG